MMMCVYKKIQTIAIVVCISCVVFAESALFELGGKSGWGSLQYTENIQMCPGRYGHTGISLRSSVPKITQTTDLYVSFDTPAFIEESGSYTVAASNMRFTDSDKAKYGTGAGVCSPHVKTAGLVLSPQPDSLFASSGTVPSFTIEFWIAPAVAENGSIILQWESAYFENKRFMEQHIIAQILQNKLQWDFFNIWQDKNGSGIPIQLRSTVNLIPSQWSHHLVAYNEEIGLLEYRMNGRTESIVYITEYGRENDAVLPSRLGDAANILIGRYYAGMIDELKITKQFVEPFSIADRAALFDRYNLNGGRVESLILDSGGVLSEAKKISAVFDKPQQTEVSLFIRAGDNKYAWTENSPPWQPVKNSSAIKNVHGRYFQIAAQLYPDADGQKTPVIHSIQLEYQKDREPLPPARVFASAQNGSAVLSWAPSVDFDTKGYMIYFGERKGEYFSAGSPVNAGNTLSYTVPNLENGKIYFFTVAAYDDEEGTRVGTFSQEVWVRPREE